MEVSLKNTKSLGRELERLGSLFINIPLDRFTTFRTGGIADMLFEPAGEEQLCDALQLLRGEGIPCTFIGGGSNLLVSDHGIRGAVIKICREDEKPVFCDDLVYAPAWVSKEMFISFAIENSLGGIEFMAGIPGTVGGGIYMNAGTNTGCFSDILRAVKIVRPGSGIETVEADSSLSLYRKNRLPEGSAIVGGFFSLPVSGNSESVKKCVEEIINERRMKHPMEYPSAGSVFRNPKGHSSWKLINDAGLKGCRYGGAMVSEKHTNFIINTGGATSSDIYKLVKRVQQAVFASTGVMLETEIRLLGDFD
ncbi:MAG TPA: UDP-N-acetylmuramate dehydrogenase [Spirochaetota bacterium]|nr:UDP-N-acetylmuramate dehydrogenase [Spirochaetota bacterium]